MNARDEILARVRAAVSDRPVSSPALRDYRTAGPEPGDVELFTRRVADYRATVHRNTSVDDVLAARAIARIVVPDGVPEQWLPALDVVREPVGTDVLDDVGAVLTTCAVAIAETGTIVLDAGPGQGPRALTLVPDYHLVIVRAGQILPGVPEAIAALDATRPLTWISGPSATSDIELDRVEGVHGPRTLDVLIVE